MENTDYALKLIAEERMRQLEDEDWTPDHDDCHTRGQLALAASCYANPNELTEIDLYPFNNSIHTKLKIGRNLNWPWNKVWWKPSPNNRIRELVKAGALIVAEIERLKRLENG